MQKVLAVDIGGTKTLVQVAEVSDVHVQPLFEQRFSSADFESFAAVLKAFLSQHPQVSIRGMPVCIGVAGPVRGDYAKVTNLPWSIDASQLTSQFSLQRLRLINDFQAIGYGLGSLRQGDLLSIQTGETPAQGLKLILGAGTGLGHCCVLGDDAQNLRVLASEAGHSAFSPQSPLQNELWQFLYAQSQYVSWEDVLSGQGMENLYRFFCQKYQDMVTPELEQQVQRQGVAPAIVALATAGSDSLANHILDMFVQLYASQAGNMALATMALGGVYLAGGIAPRIAKRLQSQQFLRAFHAKGKMREMMPRFPVYLINEPRVGLLGAAVAATQTV